MNAIRNFRNDYYFLSNMYPCKIELDGLEYRCAEAAFQAQKKQDQEYQVRLTRVDGYAARKIGKEVSLTEDEIKAWDKKRIEVMRRVVRAKFTQNKDLMEKLKKTRDAELIEENGFGDTFWGICRGEGTNWLGKILMDVRTGLLGVKRPDYVDVIADAVFTPDSEAEKIPKNSVRGEDGEKRISNQSARLREEAGEKSQGARVQTKLSLSDLLDGIKVERGYFGTPDEGAHNVNINDVSDPKRGRNGEIYLTIDFIDDKTGVIWSKHLNADELADTFRVISFYNGGILAGRNGKQALNVLKTVLFTCWTVQADDGKTITYFDKEKYDKCVYARSKNTEKKQKQQVCTVEDMNRPDDKMNPDNVRKGSNSRPTENQAMNAPF